MTYKSKVLEFHGHRLKLSISSYRRDLREVSDVFLCKKNPTQPTNAAPLHTLYIITCIPICYTIWC